MAAQAPASARRNYLVSTLLAQRTASQALEARPRGVRAVASVVRQAQMVNAYTSQRAVAEMLAEQDIEAAAEALLNTAAFTTEVASLEAMVDATETDAEFERMVASIVQDAARAAESVAVTVRPNIYHVRFVSLPCCARCAVLAGHVYPWSTGFDRHPGCDCSMIPTTVASPFWQDPMTLVEQGQVRGLSKADMQALNDGADLGRVVNVRLKKAGLLEAGHALTRRGKLTPSGIYRQAGDDRDRALELLEEQGYITTRARPPQRQAGAGGGDDKIPPARPVRGEFEEEPSEQARQIGRELLDSARRVEPEVTRDLAQVADAEAVAGSLQRLDARLKDLWSLGRKIDERLASGVDPAEIPFLIRDTLRYTMVLDDSEHWRLGTLALGLLQARGYEVVRDPAGWSRSGYRGRNVTLRYRGQMFEVQFHTGASLRAAEASHGFYEEQRQAATSDARRRELQALIDAIFDAVPVPADVPLV